MDKHNAATDTDILCSSSKFLITEAINDGRTLDARVMIDNLIAYQDTVGNEDKLLSNDEIIHYHYEIQKKEDELKPVK